MSIFYNPESVNLIPRTKRRTPLSVGIYYSDITPQDWLDFLKNPNNTKFKSVFGSGKGALKQVAKVEGFNEREDRTVTLHHELDADIPQQIIGIAPKLVEERTITLRHVLFYSDEGPGDVLQAFGYGQDQGGVPGLGWTLYSQRSPFNVIKIEVNPNGIKQVVSVYTSCWLTNNPKDYEITGDFKILQEVELRYKDKHVFIY